MASSNVDAIMSDWDVFMMVFRKGRCFLACFSEIAVYVNLMPFAERANRSGDADSLAAMAHEATISTIGCKIADVL